jgi:hypothetical protein
LLRSPKDPTWFIFEAAEILENIRIGLNSEKFSQIFLAIRRMHSFRFKRKTKQKQMFSGEPGIWSGIRASLTWNSGWLSGIRTSPTWKSGWLYLEIGIALPGIRAGPTWNSGWPYLEFGLALIGNSDRLYLEFGLALIGNSDWPSL